MSLEREDRRVVAFGRFVDHDIVHPIVNDETRETACGFFFPTKDNSDVFEIEPRAPMYRDICGVCEDALSPTPAATFASLKPWRPTDAR